MHEDLLGMTTDQLRAEFERLTAEAGGFDRRTTQLEREWTDSLKRARADRKSERDRLLARKLAAGVALRAAEEREKNEAKGEAIAAEVLGTAEPATPATPAMPELTVTEPDTKPETSPETTGSPASHPEQPTEQPGPSSEPTQPTQPDEKPVTVGMYASVSNKVIGELIEANDATIKQLPDVAPPQSRGEAIALLVRAGVRPPKRD